jgi:hypothetical protein
MALERAWQKALVILLIAYSAASLVHHVHNAEFLTDYPNLPAWLTRTKVYAAWLGEALIGALGYLLLRRGRHLAGLCLTGIYALLGFDGFGHYALAPVGAHTAAMNATIWLEAGTATLLLAAVAVLTRRLVRRRPTAALSRGPTG